MPKPWKIPKSQTFNTQISPLQCKSILVCENTQTESINFNKKFHLKHIDRPHPVRRSFWWKVLHAWHGRSIWRSATAVSPSITAQLIDIVWVEDSGGPKVSFIVTFGFSIRTSPQCKSILVCENTKMESIYFDGKFPSKYVDRPCQESSSYSSYSKSDNTTFQCRPCFTSHLGSRDLM